MRRVGICLFCFVVCVASQSFAQGITHTVGDTGGGSTTVTLTFNSYNQTTSMWLYTVTMTNDSGLVPSGTTTINDIGQQGSYSSSSVNESNLVTQGFIAANTAATFTCSNANTSGDFSASVTSPVAPPKIKQVVSPEVNNAPVSVTYTYVDATTGAVIGQDTVLPGSSSNFLVTDSTGDNVNVIATNSNSNSYINSAGDVVSGIGPSGATQWSINLGQLSYNAMSVEAQNGSDNANGYNTNVIQGSANNGGSSTIVSGVVQGAQFSIVSGINSGGAIGAITPPFGPGNSLGDTGNTAALEGGDYDSGVDSIVKAIGTGDASLLNALELIYGRQAVSGAVVSVALVSGIVVDVSGSGGGSGSFPSAIDIANFPSALSINNFPSSLTGGGSLVSGSVSVNNFPSSIVVSNMVSGVSVLFPSSITVGVENWPSDFPDSAAISDLNSIKTNTGLMVSSLGLLAGRFGGISGYDGGASELSSAQSAAASLLGGTSWGAGIGPSFQGVAGSVVVPTGDPADVISPSGAYGGFVMPTLSWVEGGSIFAAGTSIFRACRPLLALVACIAFMGAIGSVFHSTILALMLVPQSVQQGGIEDFAPGIPQGKVLVLATAIVTASAGAVAAMLAIIDGDLAGVVGLAPGAVASVVSSATTLDLSGLGSGVALVNRYVPCALIIELSVLRLLFPYAVSPVYAAAASLIRFLSI